MHRILLAFAASCLLGTASSTVAEPVSDRRAAELEHLVRQDCGSCHGMTLKGGLGPDIRAERLASADPATIAAIILDGVPGKPMPPWRSLLSEADALWIAHYLMKENGP